MNLQELFFGVGPAIQTIFQLGYSPKEEDFCELTYEQYQAYFKQFGHTEEKVYMLLPTAPEAYKKVATDEALSVTESEKLYFKSASEMIDKYCKDKQFDTYENKLRYAATLLPDVFSKGTPFEVKSLHIVSKAADESNLSDIEN